MDRIYSGDPRAKYSDTRRYWCEIIGRLRPGVTLQQAEAALVPVFHQFASNEAKIDAERANLPKLHVADASRGLDQLRRRYSKPLFFLMTLVGLILAIACANLANLLLARSAGRRREMAVRLSLGAGRGRIIRQLLTESLLLASLGGLAGLLFAHWGIRGLTVLVAGDNESFVLESGLNWRVLAVTMGLAMLTGILFGLAPALQSTRFDLTTAFKQTRAGESRKRIGAWLPVSLSQSLVVTQIAVSLLLLVAAGLFVRTLSNLNSIEPGFNRETHSIVRGQRAAGRINQRDHASLLRGPAGAARRHPRRAFGDGIDSRDGLEYGEQRRHHGPGIHGKRPGFVISLRRAGFLSTFEIPVLLGRPIDARDVAGAAKVAVVNEIFVKNYFAGQNPLGRRFSADAGRARRRWKSSEFRGTRATPRSKRRCRRWRTSRTPTSLAPWAL